MTKCSACGNNIDEGTAGLSVSERDLVYHTRCVPYDLLTDAVGEWNAVVNRGIAYFVNKYLSSKIEVEGLRRAAKPLNEQSMLSYCLAFTEMGKTYRNELERRKRKRK